MQAWLICDRKFQRRYPFGMSKPFPVPTWPVPAVRVPDAGARRWPNWPPSAASTRPALEQTVAEFNRHARVGEDPEFDRGVTAFNRASGDPEHGPNPSLAPLEKGPFYAIKVLPGSFGTFFGLRADADARVLDADGRSDPRAVRRRQRPGQRDGRALPVGWHQHRTGDDVRLHRRPARSPEYGRTRTSIPQLQNDGV